MKHAYMLARVVETEAILMLGYGTEPEPAYLFPQFNTIRENAEEDGDLFVIVKVEIKVLEVVK